MKKIIIGLVLMSCVGSVNAQFQNIDSLRRFINKFIGNSAIDAFTNKRLNTILNGLTNFLDSAYSASPASKLDSVVLVNDSILVSYKNGSVTHRDTISGGTGSPNISIGSGYKIAVNGTNSVKSLTIGAFINLDTSVTGQIKVIVDSAALVTWLNTSHPFIPFQVDSTNGLRVDSGTSPYTLKLIYNSTAYIDSILAAGTTLSVTTTGSSGPATLTGGTLNIPQYSGGGTALAIGAPITGSTAKAVLTVNNGKMGGSINGFSFDSTMNTVSIGGSPSNARLGVYTNDMRDSPCDTCGAFLVNNANASATYGQVSPAFGFASSGWKTTGGGSVANARAFVEMYAVQGVTSPLGTLRFRYNIDFAGNVIKQVFAHDGRVAINNSVVGDSMLHVTGGAHFTGGLKVDNIAAGVGTKSVRWNPATGNFTYSDTTSSVIPANPTAKAGITAVNGSAPTFMRSDAAAPVDTTVIQTKLTLWPAEVPYGVIYKAVSFPDTLDFKKHGSLTLTKSGPYLDGTGGSITASPRYANYLTIGKPHLHTNFFYKVIVKEGTLTSDSWGKFRPALSSINTSLTQPIDIILQMGTDNTGSRAPVLMTSTGTTLATAPSNVTFSSFDVLSYELTLRDSVARGVVKNLTVGGGDSAVVTYSYSPISGTSNFKPNTSYFAMYFFGPTGTETLQSVEIYSDEIKNPNIAAFGPSRSTPYFEDYWAHGWPQMLNANYPTVAVRGGGADGLAEMLAQLDEIIILNPRFLLWTDPFANTKRGGGMTFAQAVKSFDSAVQVLRAHNITVFTGDMPEDSTQGGVTIGYSEWNNYRKIKDGIYRIPIWDSIGQGTNRMAAIYQDAGIPGLHLNTLGQAKVYQTIVDYITRTGLMDAGLKRSSQGRYSSSTISAEDMITAMRENPSSSSSGLTGLTVNNFPIGTSSTSVGPSDLNYNGSTLISTTKDIGVTSGVTLSSSAAADLAPISIGTISGIPSISMYNAAASTNQKLWNTYIDATTYHMRTLDGPTVTTGNDFFFARRSGNSVDLVSFPLGNVGIGTSSPSAKLHVNGTSIFDGDQTLSGLQIIKSSTGGTIYYDQTTNTASMSVAALNSTSGVVWYDQHSVAERMRLNNVGQLGLGQTSPTAWLHLPASTTSYASLRIPSGTAPTSPNAGDAWYDGTHLYFKPSGSAVDLLAGGGSLPLTTTGDIIYSSSGSTAARLGIGTAGQTLHGGTVPVWKDTLISASGSFSPTVTSTNTGGSVTVVKATYIRVGNVVQVSIGGTFTPTSTSTATTITFDLPIAAPAVTQSYVGSGVIAAAGAANVSNSGYVQVNSTGTTGFFATTTTATSGTTLFNVHFQYTL